VANPYMRAYKDGAMVGIPHRGKINGPSPAVLRTPVIRVRRPTDRQLRKQIRAGQHASAASLECSRSLDIGAAAFEATIAPTVGDLLAHSQRDFTHPSTFISSHTIPSCLLAVARATPGACASVSKEHGWPGTARQARRCGSTHL